MVNKKKLKKNINNLNNSFYIFFLILIILLISFSIYLISLAKDQKKEFFKSFIYECDKNNLEEYINISNSTLFLKLITNCCGTEFKVYKINKNIFIEEIETGPLCRCICSKKVIIYTYKENYNNLYILKRDCRYFLENFKKSQYKLDELNKSC
ncbi:MAG: hypothetical protein QXQ19_00770 [Candidatus Aenigmatarchaeota archaeon]